MKKYIWRPQVLIDNLKRLGTTILMIIAMIAMCTCPNWMM